MSLAEPCAAYAARLPPRSQCQRITGGLEHGNVRTLPHQAGGPVGINNKIGEAGAEPRTILVPSLVPPAPAQAQAAPTMSMRERLKNALMRVDKMSMYCVASAARCCISRPGRAASRGGPGRAGPSRAGNRDPGGRT